MFANKPLEEGKTSEETFTCLVKANAAELAEVSDKAYCDFYMDYFEETAPKLYPN